MKRAVLYLRVSTLDQTVANQERVRISERVRAGLRPPAMNSSALGRPRVFVSRSRIESLRQEGMSWREIAQELNIQHSHGPESVCGGSVI